MALTSLLPFSPIPRNPDPNPQIRPKFSNSTRNQAHFMANSGGSSSESTKLVTFLGKGGSGKTTAAVLAAKYYAKEGFRTCLVVHSQDLTAEQLMGCKIGSSPTMYSHNLSAVRLETSKILLEPLAQLKKADARMNLTQGILEGIVGEELGVLPGMDSIFSALALEKFTSFLSTVRNRTQQEFDVLVYDGISTEETLRLIGATERAKWYLKYIRNMAEKTDIGRVISPSILKLAYESARLSGGSSNGKTTTEIWNDVEQILEKASFSLKDPSKLRCYLVMDPSRPASITSSLRYWGCAIQAGAQIHGAFGFSLPSSLTKEEVSKKVFPLNYALVPNFSTDSPVDWDKILDSLGTDAKHLLGFSSNCDQTSVTFDPRQKTVTLFMPGFDKTEIKLFQYRGGSELLVEAGDQRRIIRLPSALQGKVGGAKFVERNLVVTLRQR